MDRRCMVVDLDRCTGCQSCIVSCKFENSVGLGNYWCDVINVDPVGVHPDIEMYWLPLLCQQCEDSPCVAACPTGASYRDPDNGVVLIDKAKCEGKMECFKACPYLMILVRLDQGPLVHPVEKVLKMHVVQSSHRQKRW